MMRGKCPKERCDMKLMLASDIHGSAKWCAAMLDAWKAEALEKAVYHKEAYAYVGK